MLQRLFVDGCFDPALQQFLRLHVRNDDFATTIGKARQYVDAQEQAKLAVQIDVKAQCAIRNERTRAKSNQTNFGWVAEVSK